MAYLIGIVTQYVLFVTVPILWFLFLYRAVQTIKMIRARRQDDSVIQKIPSKCELASLVVLLYWAIYVTFHMGLRYGDDCDGFGKSAMIGYGFGFCFNGLFLYFRYEGMPSILKEGTPKSIENFFLLLILCCPIYVTLGCVFSIQTIFPQICSFYLPPYHSYTFLGIELCLCMIGFWLFYQPITKSVTELTDAGIIRVIRANFLAMCISLGSTMLFQVYVSNFSSEASHTYQVLVWIFGIVDVVNNALSINVAFRDIPLPCLDRKLQKIPVKMVKVKVAPLSEIAAGFDVDEEDSRFSKSGILFLDDQASERKH